MDHPVYAFLFLLFSFVARAKYATSTALTVTKHVRGSCMHRIVVHNLIWKAYSVALSKTNLAQKWLKNELFLVFWWKYAESRKTVIQTFTQLVFAHLFYIDHFLIWQTLKKLVLVRSQNMQCLKLSISKTYFFKFWKKSQKSVGGPTLQKWKKF